MVAVRQVARNIPFAGRNADMALIACAMLRLDAIEVPPIGANYYHVFDMQRSNAMGEYFVIFEEDWIDSTDQLNKTGERHLMGIVKRWGLAGDPVRIEPIGDGPDDKANIKRKVAIVDALVAMGIAQPIAAQRVVLGFGRAEGLRNADIESVVQRAGGTGHSGSGGGSGGGNFGGSGSIGGFGGFGGTGIGGFR